MREQARQRTVAGQFAFFATVEDVDRDGLDGALGAADRTRLALWRGSEESAWFFVDSIDEAKLGRVRLERAIRRIADGIVGRERQAYIILSCRLTDWEFTRDLQRLNEGLPIPRDPKLPPPPTADEVLIKTLRHEHRKEPPAAAFSCFDGGIGPRTSAPVRLSEGVRRILAPFSSRFRNQQRHDDERPLDLAQVLPDWSPQDRTRLLSRPVFDPATFGRARALFPPRACEHP
jgi:hypothetical protein